MKRLLSVFSLIALTCICLAVHGYAQEETAEEIKLYMGEIKTLPVNRPTRIAIGNPAIVDISSVTKNEITINPKAAGSTTFVFWDNFGEQFYRIRVFPENINDIKRRIDNILRKLDYPEVYTRAEEEEGKVLLLGSVKTSQDRERMLLALGSMKEKTVDLVQIKEEEAVIQIDVQVLELDKDATRTLGFSNPLMAAGSSGFGITESGSRGITGSKWQYLFSVLNWSRSAFAFKLYALEQEGKARVLSRPRLSCQSGKEAELLVGGEKPIFTTQVASAGGQGTQVEYKEYGIKLNIKPTVTDDNRVKLAVKVEVSETGEAETIGTTTTSSTTNTTIITAKAFPITKRNASTELFLDDGQTMAIGGLIKRKVEEDIDQTPGASKIPFLGAFFRKKTVTVGGGQGERGEIELFITLTPTIVSGSKEIRSSERIMRQPRDGQRDGPAAVIEAPLSAPAGVSLSPVNIYAQLVQYRILEKLKYPQAAKAAGFQGTVKLSLLISYQGKLLDASLKESSGYNMLDDNALAVAREISAYPPFPSSIDSEELRIEVPVSYRIE